MILIGGAYNDRSTVAALARVLGAEFDAVAYDRRGRGASGNQDGAFASERELEDLAAVIDHVGGSSCVFGHSSGAVLALEAAMRGLPIAKLAVFEPTYIVDGARPLPPADLYDRLCVLVRQDRRDESVELFQAETIGLPPEMVQGMRAAPVWGRLTALAHTLPYDVAIHHGYLLPAQRLSELRIPTLALDGSESFAWIRATAHGLTDAIPRGQHLCLEGQDHSVLHHPEALREPLIDFFS